MSSDLDVESLVLMDAAIMATVFRRRAGPSFQVPAVVRLGRNVARPDSVLDVCDVGIAVFEGLFVVRGTKMISGEFEVVRGVDVEVGVVVIGEGGRATGAVEGLIDGMASLREA
jgi:hypothetical protein